MNILKNILSVLADDPNGEMLVSEIKARVRERLSDPELAARSLRAAQDLNDPRSAPKTERTPPVKIFGRLILRLESGVWKITEEGRDHLRSLD